MRKCESCGEKIAHSGYCSSECRQSVIENPQRIAAINRAKKFRQSRVGLITPEENMADFAATETAQLRAALAEEVKRREAAEEETAYLRHSWGQMSVKLSQERISREDAEYQLKQSLEPELDKIKAYVVEELKKLHPATEQEANETDAR